MFSTCLCAFLCVWLHLKYQARFFRRTQFSMEAAFRNPIPKQQQLRPSMGRLNITEKSTTMKVFHFVKIPTANLWAINTFDLHVPSTVGQESSGICYLRRFHSQDLLRAEIELTEGVGCPLNYPHPPISHTYSSLLCCYMTLTIWLIPCDWLNGGEQASGCALLFRPVVVPGIGIMEFRSPSFDV